MEARVAGVVNLGLGILHQHFEVAAVLIFRAHPLGVFVELGGVVSLGEEVFQEDGVRNADRLQVLHGAAQNAGVDVLVADEGNLADFDLGPFLHHERDAHRGRRNGANFGADGGELPAVLGQQFLDRDFGFLDFGGIVLAFHRQPDFAFLEAVQHVAVGDRIQPGVFDLANGGPLFDVDVDAPALGRLLALEADVFKVAGVPQRVEVAFQGGFVVDVAGAGEDAGLDGFGGNAAVAVDLDLDYQILLAQTRRAQQENDQNSRQRTQSRPFPKL